MQAIELLKIISEPLRLRLLYLLKQAPLSVSELVEILALSQSNISHHIRLLRETGLVKPQKMGSLNLYSLQEQPGLPDYLQPIWQQLEQLAREIPESRSDEKQLAMVLANRRVRSGHWDSWRNLQPDLPYTMDIAFCGLPRSGRALDVGCGDGNFIHRIHNAFDEIIGLDNSPAQIEQARRSLPYSQVKLLLGTADQLPLQDNSIDTIYFRMLLHFLQKPEHALAEACRVLKPRGRIAIIDICASEPGNQEEFLATADFYEQFCRRQSNMRLLEYHDLGQVYLANLEKTEN